MTHFQLLYGRAPPTLLKFEEGSTENGDVVSLWKERDAMLQEVKAHLIRAHDVMKNAADKKMRDLSFTVGDMVFLKLRPYRQTSVTKRFWKKLRPNTMVHLRYWRRLGKWRISFNCLRIPRFIRFFMCHN